MGLHQLIAVFTSCQQRLSLAFEGCVAKELVKRLPLAHQAHFVTMGSRKTWAWIDINTRNVVIFFAHLLNRSVLNRTSSDRPYASQAVAELGQARGPNSGPVFPPRVASRRRFLKRLSETLHHPVYL